MNKKKLFVGITAPPSVDLIIGQLNFFKSEYEVYLLAPDDPRVREYCEKERVQLIPVNIQRNLSPIKDLITLIQLCIIYLKYKPDIINLGTPKISLLGMIAGKITSVPFRLYTCRGLRFEREKGFMRKLLFTLEKITALCADRIFCISASLKNLGVNSGVFPEEKTVLFGNGSSNGVDLKIFNPKQVNKNESAALSLKLNPEKKFVFGFVGRLTDIKGISELYDAFNTLNADNPDTILMVIGRPIWDHISEPKIIDKMEAHPSIKMLGFQPINLIPLYMSIMNAFVVPSRGEGFGNVYIQAAAMGLPIIGTDVTGCRDAVKNEYNGLLAKPRSADSLKLKMQSIFSDKTLRKRFAANSLEWAKGFAPQIIWDSYMALFKKGLK